ncbi:leukotriene B4 receptor 1-like [Sphaeramia orbicularis]|uniref:Leukotriene B4 receptor 1-like n=1 Tax=Sphaeramia orbicularis TaxID=375764 RepID=A0A673BVD1_9TELE|nr:leukotriene B4 receptor 1-like [Sphaeramia orbicularis]
MNSTQTSASEASEDFNAGSVAVCVILGLSFLIGAPGNLMVIWTILRHVKQCLHNVVLILHLAFADLLAIITLPLWIYSIATSWQLGHIACKTLVYTVSCCMFSSIFLITLMSVGHFLAICHPLVMMRLNTRIMSRCLTLLWILAVLLAAPALLIDETDCFSWGYNSSTNMIVFSCLEIFFGFIVPLLILGFCYCRVAAQLRKINYNSKQKSMVLILCVTITFTLCWLPHHIISIATLNCILQEGTTYGCVPKSVVLSSGALLLLSSSVNPVAYMFFGRNLQGSSEDSKLVRLFKEMATQTNRLVEQQQTARGQQIPRLS